VKCTGRGGLINIITDILPSSACKTPTLTAVQTSERSSHYLLSARSLEMKWQAVTSQH
jgi:hypothetical protein